MKALIQILFCTSLFAGLNFTATAQRGHSGGGSSHGNGGGGGFSSSRGGGGNFAQPHESFHESAPRTFNNAGRNNTVASERFQSSQRFNNNAPAQQRNAVVRNNNYNFNQSRQSSGGSNAFPRPVNSSYNRAASPNRVNGRSFNNYTVNNYHYNSRYYGGGYYSYNHRNYSFMYGPRYSYIPRNSLYLSFGGFPYYYNAGFYYGYYGGFYQPLFPPFGLRIATLPFGYYSFYMGGYPYYYYNGIYYQQYQDQYEVVDAPMGATIRSLPEGVKPVVINGEKLYELNGTYYKEGVNGRGKTIYTVVGKNGQVNNTDAVDEGNIDNGNNGNNSNNDYNGNGAVAPQTDNNNLQNDQVPLLQVGDMVDQLPQGSKSVTINGSAMYVTPDNVYLQEQSSNGSTTYKVVGK